MDSSKGEHKSPEVLAINPRGQVSTFKDGDVIVNESMGIIQYLEATYPDPPLMPKDAAKVGKVLQRFHEVNVVGLKFVNMIQLKYFGKGTEDEQKKLMEEKIATYKEELSIWNKYLGEDDYAAGSMFTIADVALVPFLLITERFGAKFAELPNVKKYVDRLKERPSVAATWPPHWKTSPGTDHFLESV